MTVIQIRGTSGSGKSTVMKQVMLKLTGGAVFSWDKHYLPPRKKPLYYSMLNGTVAVLGHYESPCGGCDTIGSAAQVYKEITALLAMGVKTVLAEGLLLSEDFKWSSQLPDLRVVFLTTPLESCLANIIRRRIDKAGNKTIKELNPINTTNRVAVIERSRVKLIAAGATCCRASADQAVRIILNWIK